VIPARAVSANSLAVSAPGGSRTPRSARQRPGPRDEQKGDVRRRQPHRGVDGDLALAFVDGAIMVLSTMKTKSPAG